MEIIAFLSGILAVEFGVFVVLLVFLLQCLLFFKIRFLFFFLAGMLLAVVHNFISLPQGMPDVAVLQHARLTGQIVDVAVKTGGVQQYIFSLSSYNNNKTARARMLLRCYRNCPSLLPGQEIEADAKIKRPRNAGNPGAFNYVRWARARHIDWVGYLRPKTIKLLNTPIAPSPLKRIRKSMADKLDAMPLTARTKSIVLALALGFGDQISRDSWQLFRQTGTAHLMVISGAHIGLVAGLLYLLVLGIWRWIPGACLWIPAQRVASITAIASALLYALISGFAVPAQRALIACGLYFARNLHAPFFGSWQIFRYAMLAVLIYEPHAVLMPGFYLSFSAVAILLFANQWLQCRGILKHFALQAYCLLGLLPLTLYCFGYGALNGFFANLVAIPLVGFIVVPVALLTTLLALIPIQPPLVLVEYPIRLLLFFLHTVDQFSWINLAFQFNHPLIPLMMSLLLWGSIVLPTTWFLWPVLCTILALSAPRHLVPGYGDVRMDVIDVGQGLSVLVETQNHRLLYDTGAKFYQGPDMGSMAILPYLQIQGIRSLDYVVISHPDLDHRGGLVSIEAGIKTGGLIVDDPQFYKRGLNCHSIPPFEWDGVRFEFLNLLVPLKPRNNHSCVLRIYNEHGQFLLTGDIERESEQWLMEHHAQSLPSTVLVAPHHGSKTSSSRPFLAAVDPKVVIISSGFDNRFHFPHHQTLESYRQQKAQIWNTAEAGLISVELQKDGLLVKTTLTK